MAATSAPKEVVQLVERFNRNRDSCLSGNYNETQLRREFLPGISVPLAVSSRPIAVSELCGLTEEEIRIVAGGQE